MSSAKSFEEVKEVVEEWWSKLQFERKCNSTNTVQKIVKSSPPEIQDQVRGVIVGEIKKLIEKCCSSNDLNEFQRACNAINGCFDNFIHAVDAVRTLFPEVVFFIDFGLAECLEKLHSRTNQKNAVLELLHSLSRILILVLKLKRTQSFGKALKNNAEDKSRGIEDLPDPYACKCLLSKLTEKISKFLVMDDILIDTKNNFSMSGILIREILIPDENMLRKFHKNFIESIPDCLSEEEFKLNILKFLTCSAIINTWSVNIIESDSTYVYLKFFISLCEKYSSETPIVLNTSRTLLLLIRHDSFKTFINTASQDKVEQIISLLLSCIFMLLEHPVPCVRHSAKDFLQLLAEHSSLHSVMLDSVFKLPTDKRSYFISVGAMANAIGSEILIKNNEELPKQLITALSDPTIVSHVSLALEFVILKHSLAEKNFPEWCETWIVPLLISLMSVPFIVAADIEKLLEKAFKKYPNSVVYVIDRWSNPSCGEELRYVVTALKISQKQGFKLKRNLAEDEDDEKDLISEKLLEHCLHQRDDDIRVSAFSLLIEAHKSTKPYSERDFKLINYFFKYNLNNQQPATRQKILGLVRKMLVRFSESKATLLKPSRSAEEQERKSKSCTLYDEFLKSLVAFCFSNVFVGCNFNRLNTVLNILLLCFENVKDMAFDSDKTDFYWSKFLVALDSSYEENKALAVVLANKLDFSVLSANKPQNAKSLYEKAFNLCTHMEPPDVLTGAYLLQILVQLPSSKKVLPTFFSNYGPFDDVYLYCIKILLEKLKDQIQLAQLDLMTAATCWPMYGALFAIRLIFKNVHFSDENGRCSIDRPVDMVEWGSILNELVNLCFDMTRTVGCVVNSSSPEGHLPMDFQTNYENLLSSNFDEKCTLEDTNGPPPDVKRNAAAQLLSLCTSFRHKMKNFLYSFENPFCDFYESLRSNNALLKENNLLINKLKTLCKNDDKKYAEELEMLNQFKIELENSLERLQKITTVIEWPATAQVLLLCAWRSIKEASLYLGDLVLKLPIEMEIKLGLLTKETIIRIGEEFKSLLCGIKHRGAFEHAYIGFSQLVNSLWKCSDKFLNNLPKQWLEDITNQLESPIQDQKVRLCSTRRSAGLPFLVQAIICSEIISVKSPTPSSLHYIMKALLNIIENGVSENPDAKIHALNVLRALFKHSQLGEHVASYVSKALMVAIRGSRASSWSERNSSSLLFSSLITRIFGVSRSREEISKKNRMTSRTFFQRYSELYEFLLSEMELVYSKENYVNGLYPKPSLYLVLLILGRLYPPPTEDPDNIDLSEFLPYINKSRRNPIMKIRELGARALVPLIPLDRLFNELDERFSVLSSKTGVTDNEKHGILLQINELLSQSQEAFENLSQEKEATWIENTKWLLESQNQTSLIISSAYIKVLHILFKNFPSARERIAHLISTLSLPDNLLSLNDAEQSLLPGIYLFLENFYFLKTDVLACQWLLSDEHQARESFFELFLFMLKCKVSEVQSVPLRILCHALADAIELEDDDDFSGITALVTDLLVFQSKEKTKNLEKQIINNSEILKCLTNSSFESTAIHKLWSTVVGNLVLDGVISLNEEISQELLNVVHFAEVIEKSGDKDFTTCALICYAVYLIERISAPNGPSDDRSVLFNLLNKFSDSDMDIKERLAVARIINRCYKNFLNEHLIDDPTILKIWMIPFKLIADEDPRVRAVAAQLVHKLQKHLIEKIPKENYLIEMKTLDWPNLPLVSLKAQESLLDCYINVLGNKNLPFLVAQMLTVAASSICDLDEPEGYSKDEFGVFEKGNPNPFCEDLSLSNLMCHKLNEMKALVDLNALLRGSLNESWSNFMADSFNLSGFHPSNLMEVLEKITRLVEKNDKLEKDFSIPQIQIKNLRDALGLSEC